MPPEGETQPRSVTRVTQMTLAKEDTVLSDRRWGSGRLGLTRSFGFSRLERKLITLAYEIVAPIVRQGEIRDKEGAKQIDACSGAPPGRMREAGGW